MRYMSDNTLDLPPRGPARHRAILAAREQYIEDSLRCPGDGVLIHGDEMHARVGKMSGAEVRADDLNAEVQCWDDELRNQFKDRCRDATLAVALTKQLENYETAPEEFTDSRTLVVTRHHAAMLVSAKDRAEDLFHMR